MFQEFPYTNFHQLNLDWIVKIAKDFLDQYTHIQEVIQTGLDDLAESRETGLAELDQKRLDSLAELNQKTMDGLADLQDKYDTLNGLLQAWYDTHSADIAGQLADAIIDFNTAAEAKSQALLDSWPADYSELVTGYNNLKTAVTKKATDSIIDHNNLLENVNIIPNAVNSTGTIASNADNDIYLVNLTSGTKYFFKGVRFIYDGTTLIFNTTQINQIKYVTASVTGLHYVTVNKTVADAFLCTESNYLAGDYGTLLIPLYDSNTLAQTPGTSQKKPASQKMVGDSIKAINITELSGIGIADGTNLLSTYVEYYAGKYASKDADTGKVKFNNNASYNCYVIPVSPGRYTYSDNARMACYTDTLGGNVVNDGYYSNAHSSSDCPQDGNFLYLSIDVSYTNFMIARGYFLPTATKYKINNLYDEIPLKIYGNGYARAAGNLSNGEGLYVPKTNVKKNNVYSFTAEITTFSSIQIGHGTTLNGATWIEIDSTNVTLHCYGESDITYPHGLSISNYIDVQIIVGTGTAIVKVYSDGALFTHEVKWLGDDRGDVYVKSVNSTLTNCVFTWSSEDFRKSLWIFGDSYLTFGSETRWPYYIIGDGFIDNVLLNAYPGETSQYANVSLHNALNYYGKPEKIVWALGMNDGSDSDNTPNSNWSNYITLLLNYCTQFGITPILATIPSVPSINHEAKNSWVRNSGYRYIDFAKAVGAQANGTWYEGMLSSDNVHPTEKGAKALYFRALLDCPEITFSNP